MKNHRISYSTPSMNLKLTRLAKVNSCNRPQLTTVPPQFAETAPEVLLDSNPLPMAMSDLGIQRPSVVNRESLFYGRAPTPENWNTRISTID